MTPRSLMSMTPCARKATATSANGTFDSSSSHSPRAIARSVLISWSYAFDRPRLMTSAFVPSKFVLRCRSIHRYWLSEISVRPMTHSS